MSADPGSDVIFVFTLIDAHNPNREFRFGMTMKEDDSYKGSVTIACQPFEYQRQKFISLMCLFFSGRLPEIKVFFFRLFLYFLFFFFCFLVTFFVLGANGACLTRAQPIDLPVLGLSLLSELVETA